MLKHMAAFEDCGTLTAASASTGAINLLGGKVRRVRAVCLPASEGGGPRVRIRLAPARSQGRTRAETQAEDSIASRALVAVDGASRCRAPAIAGYWHEIFG